MKQPKFIIQTFSDYEVKRMINYYSGSDFLSIRNKTIMCMLFDTGILLSELITLTNEQIYSDYILIHGKGDKERVVPKSPYLSKWIFKHQIVKNSYFYNKVIKHNNVFLSRNGLPLTHESIEGIVRNAGKKCNVDSVILCSPHTARHT